MTWLTWRQLRTQAAAVSVLVAAVVAVAASTGPRLLHLARTGTSVFDALSGADRALFYAGVIVLALAPAVIGAFWGAPLVARELEAGTHRLVWQSVTRTRWLATKLGLTALAAALAAGALSLSVTWWSAPLDGATSSTRGSLPSRLAPVTFAMRGLVPVAYTIFALVLGIAFGIVLRRSLPAMALTLAVFAAVQVVVPLWVRPHLVPPVSQTLAFTAARLDSLRLQGADTVTVSLSTGHRGDWILSNQTVDAAGKEVALPSWFGRCQPSAPLTGPGQVQAQPIDPCLARLNAEGYRQHVVYQPASRFWALQWAESALFGVASVLLAGFCFWWTRTRLS